MIDFQAIEDSRKLYDSVKEYFANLKLSDCVIEISEKSMSEWVIHFTKNDEEMNLKRFELADLEKPFISVYSNKEGTYLLYNDKVIRSLELLNQNKYEFFNIVLAENIDREKLVKELKELKKILSSF